MHTVDELFQAFASNEKSWLADYFDLLSFASISAEQTFENETKRCARWLEEKLRHLGFSVEQWSASGNPVVFASKVVNSEKPTLLIYNHFDVQPVDPLSLWKTPPFEPRREGDYIYARGAQDNKGQLAYVLFAVEYLSKKSLPINISLILDGAEEIGSPGLSQLLKEKSEKIKSDYLLIVDCGIPNAETPAITLGVRGEVSLWAEVYGPTSDLHSGSHGGIAYNPAQALSEAIAELHDDEGRVTVPEFYKDVVELDSQTRAKLDLRFDSKAYEAMFGIPPLGGENNFSPIESSWIRPTLEITGITSGYVGEEAKTIIPAKARAAISCRLVPNQDPEHISQAVLRAIESKVRGGLKVRGGVYSGFGKAFRSDPNSAFVGVISKALSEVFRGKDPVFILEGIAIPVAPALSTYSGADAALIGFGLPDDSVHAPNERFSVSRLQQGFQTIVRIVELMGEK